VGEPPSTVPVEAFHALDIRAGVVVSAEPFPGSRKPSLRLQVDFGPEIGVLPSVAQLTRRYEAGSLEGTVVLGVVNLPPLRIAGFSSRCLVLGVMNPDDPGDVILVRPDAAAGPAPGWKLG
jgi:tRNA-binding protein